MLVGLLWGCGSGPTEPTATERFREAVAVLGQSDAVDTAPWEVPGQRTMPWEAPRLVPALSQACGAGVREACGMAHWWFTFGPVSVQDRQKAEVHLRRGLMLSDPLSIYLGALGEPFDEARPLFVDACERGVGYSCAWVGDRTADTAARLRILQHGCELGDATSCGLYGANHIRGFQTLPATERARVLQQANTGCDEGSLLSCLVVARLRDRVGELGPQLEGSYVDRVFRTAPAPRGVVLRFPGWASRAFRVPDHGYIRAYRDGTGSRVRSLAQSDVAVHDIAVVRLAIYVASPTDLGRLTVFSSRRRVSRCPLEIRTPERRWTVRPVRRGLSASAKIRVGLLFQLGRRETRLLFCGQSLSTYSLRLHARTLALAREVLLGRLDRETWAPR